MKKIFILLLTLSLMLLSGCGEQLVTNLYESEMPDYMDSTSDSKYAEALYKLRNTSLKDEEKIRQIFEIMPYFPQKDFNISTENSTLNITYKIPLRSQYRDLRELERNLTQTLLTSFAIINDAEEIGLYVQDNYGIFSEKILTREELYKQSENSSLMGMDYFTEETIKKASDKRKTFEDYLVNVLDISYKESKNEIYYEEINKKLSEKEVFDAYELKIYNINLNKNSSVEGVNLINFAKNNNFNLSKYNGEDIDAVLFNVRDFTTGNVYKKMFIFKGNTVIGSGNM